MRALATHELTKDYAIGFWRKRPYRALDRLTLEVEPGEVFGFLGPNGAGKTTTLKLLMQLVYPTSGRAEILGRPVGDLAAKQRIGYLAENPYFYDHLTAEELLHYFAELFGIRGAERRMRVNALLLVILDEPMSGLDPLGRRDVRSLILRLRDRGCTVFFSSHVLSDAEALCSRVAILAKGRLVTTGRLTDMLALRARGWELVIAGAGDALVASLGSRVRRAIKIGEGRYTLELPLEPPPEALLADLTAGGAHLASLNPIRDTLEDLFVDVVTAPDVLQTSRGLEDPARSAS